MNNKESEKLEFKSSFSDWKAIIISLCAFANKKGGQVSVGLNDDGKFTNMKLGKNTIEDFVNKLRNHTDPILYPSINVKTFGLGEIVEIEIPESDLKPVFAFDKAYIRVGKSNVKLTASEVRKLIKAYTLPDYDEAVMDEERKDIELDIDMIDRLNKKYFMYEDLSTEGILERLEVLKKGKLSNAGYLCFVKRNRYIPSAVIKAARFKGNSMTRFIDMKDFDNNLIEAVDNILEFIRRHINMEVVIDGGSHRKETWEYPIEGLREAVINAVVHRDYSDPGNIQVRIFDDTLEVWSPGTLPKEINIQTLLKENRSIPRNRSIARIFFLIGFIENWGTGFPRIVEACRANGNPMPEFEEKAGAFVITFYKRRINEGISEGINEGLNEGLNEGINEGLNEGINEGINERINGGLNGGINGGINGLYDYITDHPGQRIIEMSMELNIPEKTLERWIRSLKEQGKIIFRGSKKTGGYFRI